MQFATLAVFAASASAAAVAPRQNQAQYINGFQAACVPHSTFCNYKFGVSSEPGVIPATNCAAHVQGPDMLPALEDQSGCTVGNNTVNGAYHWSVAKTAEGGLDFEVWYPLNSRSNISFCYDIPAKDLVVEDNGSVQTQRYTGPQYFKMDVCPLEKAQKNN
ncbi:hypothetical protein PG990_004275 [Apiospora arundinis]|uniref:Hypersensitive response-inducing protein n=1 Tax=Apiospora arundinis TaxID=335852 RepID=A0ABR2J482_9PEZI